MLAVVLICIDDDDIDSTELASKFFYMLKCPLQSVFI